MNKFYAILFVLLVVLVVCSAAVSAEYCENLNTKISGTVNGGVYVGGGHGSDGNGPPGEDPYEQDFSVPSGTIKWARLYTGVWASGNSDGWINISFYDGTGYTSHNAYVNTSYENTSAYGGPNDEEDGYYVACGYGNYWYYWNVTDIVSNGYNNATVTTNGFDVGTVQGISLVVVYEDGGDEITYWINQGLIYLGTGDTACSCRRTESTTWFNGTMDTTQNATLWTEYFVGEPSPEYDYLEFNGHNFTTFAPDTADGSGTTPDDTWTNNRLDIDRWVIDKDWIDPSSNDLKFIRGSDTATRAVLAVFLSEPPAPDLLVSDIDTLVERDGQTPMELVANHVYTINATILNAGNLDATGFNLTFDEDGTLKNDTGLTGLGATDEEIVQFDWSNSAGSYSLKVTADAYNAVTESCETNNASTDSVTVHPKTGLADLAIDADDITFHPAHANHAANNNTIVRVKVRNEGYMDAGSTDNEFKVQLRHGATTMDETTTWLRAKCYRFVEFEVSLPEGPNTVTVELDPDGIVSETSTANNVASDSVNIATCRIMDTHEYGDSSTYNGPLSDYTDVDMFDVVKLAPEGTSPVELLKSVAITTEEGASAPIKSVDGLKQNSTLRYYWYPFANGIPIPWGDWETYPLRAGDTIHWDILNWVNSPSPDSYKAKPVEDYPEPFLHGYNDTVHNATIVYPDELCYPAKADAIESGLLAAGVPGGRISKKAVGDVTLSDKQNNNLILLGTPSNNPIIEDINSQHTDVGMPVYFDGNQMTDDYDDTTYVGGVIEACDNPYDNGGDWTEAWKDTGPSIWLAAAVEDYWAYKAADMLAGDPDKLDRFWKNRKPHLTPTWDGTDVILDWSNWPETCTSFNIYITNNLTTGFPATPNVTGVMGTTWTDTNAGVSDQRYYKVTCSATSEQIEGNVSKITYGLKNGRNWITMPSMNSPITSADELIKDIQPNCDKVGWWNPTSQQMETYGKLPFPPWYGGTNFEVKPARGYEVKVTADTTWTVVGWVPSLCPIELITGRNWIGMPFNTTINDAYELIRAIDDTAQPSGVCDKVGWWNPTSQQMETYGKLPFPPWYGGTNFEVKPARGYEVKVTADTTWTPQ